MTNEGVLVISREKFHLISQPIPVKIWKFICWKLHDQYRLEKYVLIDATFNELWKSEILLSSEAPWKIICSPFFACLFIMV